jgi:outer membrane protein TolC
MRSTFAAAALGAALATAPSVSAQQPPAIRVTLEEAQSRAIEASHRLAEARARAEAAAAAIDVREAASRPSASLQAGYTRTNHVPVFEIPFPAHPNRVIYPDIPDNYRTRIDLQWPIYTGGRTDALERAARAEAAAVAAEVSAARGDLRLETARAFWAVVTAKQAVAVLEEGVTREQAHVADVRARLDAGFVPPNDLASAEAQESRERVLLIEARNQRAVAVADLARLIGAPAGQEVDPAATLDLAAPFARDLDALIATARQARGERVAMERRIDAADAQRAAAAAGRRPQLGVGGGYDYARPNPRIFPRSDDWKTSWDASVNMVWPLWDGGRTAADVAQATAAATAARERLAEFDSTLTVEIRQRLLDIDSGRAAVAAADDAVRAETEARRVVAQRYRVGVISQTEVLDADYALLQAQLDRTRTQANVRLAEARLARVLGQ